MRFKDFPNKTDRFFISALGVADMLLAIDCLHLSAWMQRHVSKEIRMDWRGGVR